MTEVERTKSLVWSESGNKEDARGQWLVVYLTLQNIGQENLPINDHDFEVHDGAGVKYKTTNDYGTVFGFLRFKKIDRLGGQFPPGVPVSTAALFDINPTASGMKLWLTQEKRYIDLGV